MRIEALLLPILMLPVNINCNNANTVQNDEKVTQSSPTGTQQEVTNDTGKSVHFGVMVAKTQGSVVSPSQQAKIAKALGVDYIRARLNIDGWTGSDDACDIYQNAGLKLILNVNMGIPRNAAGEHDPVPFPTDMSAYSKKLNSILDKYKPEVLVVENEEDNPNYHSGDADDYINELKTAIQIAHSRGIKVTNGGITFREVCLIIFDNLMQNGKQQQAREFAQNVFPPAILMRLKNLSNPMVKKQLDFGRKIIAAYKTLDLDYVNFHWYEPVKARGANGVNKNDTIVDQKIFEFVANSLKTMTGKQIMSNEFGVFNPSIGLIKGLLQAVYDADLKYAIFYSADGGPGKAVALQNLSGDLRENGVAFRDFVRQH